MSIHKSIAWLVALGCLEAITGCGANAQDTAPNVDATSEEIIGGSTISVATRRSLGLIDVSGFKSCSGSLLTPDWAITATHCINLSNPAASLFSAPRTSGSSDTRRGERALQVGGSDVTIVKLEPVTSGMTWPSASHATGPTDLSTLVGKNITCYGRGDTGYASPSGTTGFGEWRTLTKTVAQVNGLAVIVNADNGREIFAPGDSGGGCFLNGLTVGVMSSVSPDCVDPNNCKATITKINSGIVEGVGPNAWFVDAAHTMKTVAFQANTNALWLDQNELGIATGLGMLSRTVPSIVELPGNGYAVAFQANTGNLWLDVNGAASDQHFGMKTGTSPSVAVLPNGQLVTAFQANTGSLWLDANGSGFDQGFGMMPGTSPSIAVLPNGDVAVAFQANTGSLWLDVNGTGFDQGLGMMAGTNPSLAVLPNGQVAIAFQANTGNLWLDVNGVGFDRHLGMKARTSPSLAVLPSGQTAIAFQANTGNLWVEFDGVGQDQHLGMMPSASPNIISLSPNFGWQVAFEANSGNLWLDVNGHGIDQQLGMNTP